MSDGLIKAKKGREKRICFILMAILGLQIPSFPRGHDKAVQSLPLQSETLLH
jgi:hypothetical protein